jgi:hypothetical protein
LGKLPFIPNFQFRPLQNKAVYQSHNLGKRENNFLKNKKMKTQTNSMIDYSPSSMSQNNSTVLERKTP